MEKSKSTLTKSSINLDTLAAVREQINKNVKELQLFFEQDLDKNFSSLTLFAVVAYIDEIMQRHVLETGQGTWAPLQKDFYGAYNAGELFYETIDKVIDDEQVPPIVAQVFYFILKLGFHGKFRDSKTHIEKYIDILKAKIPVATPSKVVDHSNPHAAQAKAKIKKWHYYASASALAACFLLTLYIASSG